MHGLKKKQKSYTSLVSPSSYSIELILYYTSTKKKTEKDLLDNIVRFRERVAKATVHLFVKTNYPTIQEIAFYKV